MNPAQIEATAIIAHEVNRAYCESIGDTSQLPWSEAPNWQCESAINGVQFHVDNPHALPCDSHNNWLAEKADAGWTYGPEKDPEKKQHPCMVPFDALPLDQRTKDYLFKGVVTGAIEAHTYRGELYW